MHGVVVISANLFVSLIGMFLIVFPHMSLSGIIFSKVCGRNLR